MGMTVREQFIQEGVQQGMQQGLQQGVQQGLEEGVKSVACRMLLEGVDEVFIQKITQLSFDDLKKLKREMQH